MSEMTLKTGRRETAGPWFASQSRILLNTMGAATFNLFYSFLAHDHHDDITVPSVHDAATRTRPDPSFKYTRRMSTRGRERLPLFRSNLRASFAAGDGLITQGRGLKSSRVA